MDLTQVVITSIGIGGIGLMVLLIGFALLNEESYVDRMGSFMAEQPANMMAETPMSALRSEEVAGSLASRVLAPAMMRMIQWLGRLTPVSQLENMDHQMIMAGSPFGLGAREFYGFRLLFVLLGGWLGYMIASSRSFERTNVILGSAAFLISMFLPNLWLRSRISARQNEIRRELPDALDMLSVCTTAGLAFDQALQRVSEYWDTPLGSELGRVTLEMEMGISRRDALRNLSNRLGVGEVSSFVSFLIQSDQLGMSITETLYAQADQMRAERRYRAQEQAQQVPTKMLFPMVFLIFPAILAIIIGPAVPMFAEFYMGF